MAHVSVEESDFDPYSISRPEITEMGVLRTQGEKRELQMTLDSSVNSVEDAGMKERRMARERGYTGDICASGGSSQMRRNGTCLKCDSCGETTGCS